MPAVVSDTSPLVYLTRLGHFSWLKEFYGEILIPPAVWAEISQKGHGLPEAQTTELGVQEGWVRVQAPEWRSEKQLDLDPGEEEAIRLAKQLGALLIIDESEGRAAAMSLGIQVTGTLGILVEAKARGLIPSVKAELDRLVAGTTFFLSDDIRALVLRLSREEDDL